MSSRFISVVAMHGVFSRGQWFDVLDACLLLACFINAGFFVHVSPKAS